MAVDPLLYRPILISERVEPNDVGKFDLCRASSLLMGVGAATTGEWTTRPTGTNWGAGRIKQELEAMRAATGDEDRGAYNQGHMKDMLRGIGFPPEAYKTFNENFVDVKHVLSTHVVFLAGDVKHTPLNSPLRRYVNGNVGHEIILIKLSKDGDRISFIDPMTPHGTANYLRWAPAWHFRQFASEFGRNGVVIAGTMKKGHWTKARVNGRAATKLIADLGQKVVNKTEKIRSLKVELANCENQEEPEDCARELALAKNRLDRVQAVLLD